MGLFEDLKKILQPYANKIWRLFKNDQYLKARISHEHNNAGVIVFHYNVYNPSDATQDTQKGALKIRAEAFDCYDGITSPNLWLGPTDRYDSYYSGKTTIMKTFEDIPSGLIKLRKKVLDAVGSRHYPTFGSWTSQGNYFTHICGARLLGGLIVDAGDAEDSGNRIEGPNVDSLDIQHYMYGKTQNGLLDLSARYFIDGEYIYNCVLEASTNSLYLQAKKDIRLFVYDETKNTFTKHILTVDKDGVKVKNRVDNADLNVITIDDNGVHLNAKLLGSSANGSFTSSDGKTITVVDGVITSIT